MNSQRLWQIALSILVLIAGFAFGFRGEFYTDALVSAFFGFALGSVCVIHLRLFPKLVDALGLLAGMMVFAAVDFGVLQYAPRFMAWISFLGLSSFMILTLRLVWARPEDRRICFLAVVPSLLFVSSDWFASTFLQWTEKAHPRVLDLNLLVLDGSLHVQLPFLLGQAFLQWPWLKVLSVIAYIALPIPIAIVYSGHLLRSPSRWLSSMFAFLITGPLGIVFYNIFPAMGPAHIFRTDFPWHPLATSFLSRLALTPIALPGPRNAIPSLHMAWVLLAMWYSRGPSVVERAIAAFFLIFTVFATMGLGEHYFIDLIVAFPFALFAQALSLYELPWNNSQRLQSLSVGLFLTLGWLGILRFSPKVFLVSVILPWLACAVTVAFCVYLQRSLLRATKPEPTPAPAELVPASAS